jgi:hypothetical protein
VFSAVDFAPWAGVVLIDEIALRPDAGTGQAFAGTLPLVQIDLSTTSMAPDALSTLFANNLGANNTTVFSGPLSLSSADSGPPAGPKDFDIIIPLATPFLYDFTAGNLLVDIRHFGGGPALTQFDAENTLGDSMSRVRSGPSTTAVSSASGVADTAALVVRFNGQAVPVPEPATVLFVGVGLATLMGSRPWSRRR